jgi:hypothetical protein
MTIQDFTAISNQEVSLNMDVAGIEQAIDTYSRLNNAYL